MSDQTIKVLLAAQLACAALYGVTRRRPWAYATHALAVVVIGVCAFNLWKGDA